MLSRLVVTFLPKSKCLLISWLQSPSTVILEPPKIKSDTVSTVSPSICHEVMGPDAIVYTYWALLHAGYSSWKNTTDQVTKLIGWEKGGAIRKMSRFGKEESRFVFSEFGWPRT